ncbi:kinase-like domain-containing protein [Rhizophagus irregularis DAOM 181602=DAOM 197198]|nr:kinase-like domain-containing protein [Rhizophagus irregularis DAOM 181602=DAOM 197198]
MIDDFLNEAKNYLIKKDILSKDKIYGITRKPNTDGYIIVLYNEYSQEYFKECYVKYNMGLCGEIGNIDETNIYGVMPYVAPEVLRGKPYTQAADIYSFVLDICKGIRPEINEPEAPGFYIDLMKKCWDLNPVNRPNIAEIEKTIISFYNSYRSQDDNEIKKQFQESEKYRSINKNGKPPIHPQAIYTSRLLNPFTEDLDNECLDCKI